MKKTILHIIDDLKRGGAETMLVSVVKNLPEYNNIIVTLKPENEFGNILKCDELFCLNMKSPFHIINAALKLRRIIKDTNASIIHSHLFWSTIVARIGVPKNIPLITTIHVFVKSSLEYKPWRYRVFEKYTYKIRKSTIIAVAKGALEEYFSFINIKPHNAFYLYTFVDTNIFKNTYEEKNSEIFRMVTVGNLKEQKNHRFLIEAFKELNNEKNISLDIYGKGPLHKEFLHSINEYGLNINLKGQITNINEQIGKYDLFVMSSLYEGFAISVLEAMSLGMPTLLSDISSFKEQCEGTSTFYELNSKEDFIMKLLALKNNRTQLKLIGQQNRKRVIDYFTLEKHIAGLKSIYRIM